jgi:GAF domain-containing protein
MLDVSSLPSWIEPVLEALSRHVHELFKARDTVLRLADQVGRPSPPPSHWGKYAEQNRDIIQLGYGITGSIALNGVAEVIDDLSSDLRAVHVAGTPDVEEVPETMMCAPLNASGKTIGLLSVYRDRPEGLFTQVDLNFLVGLTRQAAITIENARLYDESLRQLEEMEALTEIGRDLVHLDLPTVFDRILTRATRL